MKNLKNHHFKALLACALLLGLSSPSKSSELIELPPEELARESVLPVFDRREATKNRMIITEKKMEAHVLYGVSLSEAVSNTNRMGLGIYYNWTEYHSLGVLYAKNSSGLSSYSNQLNTKFGWDLGRAPRPDYAAFLDYNFKAYYGKMSLTKMAVGNFILFFSGSGGIVKYVHKTYPALSLGIGQKFFFNRSLSLRIDFRLQGHNAPNPFKSGLIESGSGVPEFSQFDDQFDLNQIAEVGLSYLF